MSTAERPGSVREVLLVALCLGLTSFGGPIAHLGYFRHEYVERRAWLDEAAFADLVALCQFLPGPASSQLGFAIGTKRAGIAGGIAAWIGFTAPSAMAMVGFGLFAATTDLSAAGWVHGLKLAAVAVVAQAVLLMARSLAPDTRRRLIALAAAGAALTLSTPLSQLGVIAIGALAGRIWLPAAAVSPQHEEPPVVGRQLGVVALIAFAALLVGLPVLRGVGGQSVALVDSFRRSGALVFGGGHVVLPLLHANVVAPGWVSDGAFLAGYGAAQAMPGPLFIFAAYLGTVSSIQPNGVAGGLLALVAIFLPSLLLLLGAPVTAGSPSSSPRRPSSAGIANGPDPIVSMVIDLSSSVSLQVLPCRTWSAWESVSCAGKQVRSCAAWPPARPWRSPTAGVLSPFC